MKQKKKNKNTTHAKQEFNEILRQKKEKKKKNKVMKTNVLKIVLNKLKVMKNSTSIYTH